MQISKQSYQDNHVGFSDAWETHWFTVDGEPLAEIDKRVADSSHRTFTANSEVILWHAVDGKSDTRDGESEFEESVGRYAVEVSPFAIDIQELELGTS